MRKSIYQKTYERVLKAISGKKYTISFHQFWTPRSKGVQNFGNRALGIFFFRSRLSLMGRLQISLTKTHLPTLQILFK